MKPQTLPPQPNIIQEASVATDISIDPVAAGQTMQELGISADTIDKTTIYLDPANRLVTNGIAYPNKLGRLRHVANPDLRNAEGPIVRLSSRVGGEDRSEEDMNRTLTHELEHVGQIDRHDMRLRIGHAVIWGLASLGAIVGFQKGRSTASKVGLGLTGFVIGQQIGYKVAPHEQQARSVAKTMTTTAVRRRNQD